MAQGTQVKRQVFKRLMDRGGTTVEHPTVRPLDLSQMTKPELLALKVAVQEELRQRPSD